VGAADLFNVRLIPLLCVRSGQHPRFRRLYAGVNALHGVRTLRVGHLLHGLHLRLASARHQHLRRAGGGLRCPS